MKRLLIDPLLIFLVVWGTVFSLFHLRYSFILLDMDESFIEGVWMTFGAAVFGYAAGRLAVAFHARKQLEVQVSARLRKVVRWIAAAILLIIPLEIAVSGGLPIFWLINRTPGKVYTEYGIPTLHGFFNALLLFIGTVSFWLITTRRANWKVRLLFLLCLLFPIIAITRQVLMSLIVQCAIVYVGARVRSREGVVLRVAGVFVAALSLFAIIGSFRSDNRVFRYYADLTPSGQWMPTELAWPYIYVTTPVNNLLYLTKLDPEQTWGAQSLATLTPTVIRSMLFGEKAGLAPALVRETFNVTSYATPLYLDFRWPGVIGFTGLMLFLAGWAAGKFGSRNDVQSLVLLAVYDQILIFTFFVNFLLTWGIIFQLVLLFLLRRAIQSTDATVLPKRPGAIARWVRAVVSSPRPSGAHA